MVQPDISRPCPDAASSHCGFPQEISSPHLHLCLRFCSCHSADNPDLPPIDAGRGFASLLFSQLHPLPPAFPSPSLTDAATIPIRSGRRRNKFRLVNRDPQQWAIWIKHYSDFMKYPEPKKIGNLPLSFGKPVLLKELSVPCHLNISHIQKTEDTYLGDLGDIV